HASTVRAALSGLKTRSRRAMALVSSQRHGIHGKVHRTAALTEETDTFANLMKNWRARRFERVTFAFGGHGSIYQSRNDLFYQPLESGVASPRTNIGVSMKLSAIKVDTALAEQGDWVDSIPELPGIRIKARGANNGDYRRLQAKLLAQIPRGA